MLKGEGFISEFNDKLQIACGLVDLEEGGGTCDGAYL